VQQRDGAIVEREVQKLAAAGARRISLGGWLARVATGAFLRAAEEMKDKGTFDALNQAASGRDVAGVLRREAK